MRHQTAMDLCWGRPGNTHDIHILEPLVKQVIEKVGKPRAVAADAKEKHGMRWVNILYNCFKSNKNQKGFGM